MLCIAHLWIRMSHIPRCIIGWCSMCLMGEADNLLQLLYSCLMTLKRSLNYMGCMLFDFSKLL